ncbi:hypothetical protein A0H81_14774 [Grifola frondosa]|uniref:Uncharacterized protein n=1 Tax=Grifola frondosa TaxID=5627 RepID=A0A1C7LKR5_GRIFR|nr:hypothetical protein A0H81_14774 [Grifola frondosa]
MDSTPAPALPPKPAPRTGVERIAEMHMVRAAQGEGEANEVEVGEEGDVLEYAQYAEGLLKDEAMLFVTLRSASAAEVPKVLRVVEEAKRLRHKSGIADDEELHQYVVYDTGSSSERKGPKRINLNDPDPKAKGPNYAPAPPPTSLTVHLSKIDMPELQPRAEGKQPERKEHEKHKWWEKDKGKEKEKKKAERTAGTPTRPEPNKLTKPTSWPPSSSPPDSHIHSNQVHPYQPSPSPSQLNNPSIYVAPPPPHPSHSHFFQSHAPPPFPTPSTTPGSGSGSHHDHAPSAPNPAAKGPVTSLLEIGRGNDHDRRDNLSIMVCSRCGHVL